MPVKHFKVEKVPLGYLSVDHVPAFPPCPILYLELLENKEKVLPHLKDKPHEPMYLNATNNIVPIDDNKEFFTSVNPNHERDIRSKLNDRLKHTDHVPRKHEDDRKSLRERTLEHEREVARVKELSNARQKELDRVPSTKYISKAPSVPLLPTLITAVASSSNDAESNIRSILGGEEHYAPSHAPVSQAPPQQQQHQHQLPPTLSEINNQTQGPIKNFAYTNTEDEMKRKRELLFRFDILKRSYKDAHIPEFTEYTDIKTMERIYEDTVRKVGLESKVDGYKKFLTMGFFGVEFLFTKFIGVDMSGFAKQQMSSMNSYERLLIELGEKAMIEKAKSQWPVEVRLLFTIVMNAVIFLLMKSVMNGGISSLVGGLAGGGGGDAGGGMMSGIMSMMSGLTGGGSAPAPSASASSSSASSAFASPPVKTKQKMKGPSINLDEVDKKTN